MGTLLKYFILFFCSFLFFFFFTFPASSSSSPPSDQTHSSSSSTATAQSQVFYVKHTTPFLLDRQQRRLTKNYRKRSRVGNKNKNPTTKKFKNNGPFSVMLPKGFVPPSGSSPCHNGNPNDVLVFCDLAKP